MCLFLIHIKPFTLSILRFHAYLAFSFRTMSSLLNGVYCWICVNVWLLETSISVACNFTFSSCERILLSIRSSLQIYVLHANEKKNSLQFFPHSYYAHKTFPYIQVDGTRVLFSVLLLHLQFFFPSSACCCYQALNSIKVIEQKYFWSWWWYIVCDSKCLSFSFFARYTLSSFIHLSWLRGSMCACVCVSTSIHINARFNIGY